MSQSPITFEERKGWTVVTYHEKKILKEESVMRIRRLLEMHLESHPQAKSFIMDFSKVEYMGSLLLQTLIWVDKQVKLREGKLVLCAIRADIYEVFAITRLNKLFAFADTLDEALAL